MNKKEIGERERERGEEGGGETELLTIITQVCSWYESLLHLSKVPSNPTLIKEHAHTKARGGPLAAVPEITACNIHFIPQGHRVHTDTRCSC